MLCKAYNYALNLLELQIFLTLISWPLLLCWGLPLSVLTLLGNSILMPFLLISLILCTCTTLLLFAGLPALYIISLFEYSWYWWHFILSLIDKPFFFCFVAPPLLSALFVLGLTISITLFIRGRFYRIFCYVVTFVLFFIYLNLMQPSKVIQKIPFEHRFALLIHYSGKTCLLVPKLLKKENSLRWIRTTLKRHLNKNGIKGLDYCFILHKKMSAQSFFNALHAQGLTKIPINENDI